MPSQCVILLAKVSLKSNLNRIQMGKWKTEGAVAMTLNCDKEQLEHQSLRLTGNAPSHARKAENVLTDRDFFLSLLTFVADFGADLGHRPHRVGRGGS